MYKNIVIYYKDKSKEKVSNVDLKLFDTSITFNLPSDKNIDEYISSEIILELNKTEFGVIYIKDNLSSNYLELYGLRVAYHIRLSQELGNKIYIPIVILSDIDSHILNKLDPMARILFTKNIFIVKNTKEDINKFQDKSKCKNLTKNEYQNKFLYKWANALKLTPNVMKINHNKILSMLYFKYLISNQPIEKINPQIAERPKRKGRVLLIDDEWEKGWDVIFEEYLGSTDNITFKTLKNNYRNMESDEIVDYVIEAIQKDPDQKDPDGFPDVVILDLRLCEDDSKKNKDTEIIQITGMKLIKEINKINPGIQIILWTASGDSNILNKTNIFLDETNKEMESKYKILGYVKKEYPGDRTADVYDSIKNLTKLIERGLTEEYLKDIWITTESILEILDQDPFQQHILNTKKYKNNLEHLKKEIKFVFEVLDSDKKNKLNYAVVSMARSLEVLEEIFFMDGGTLFWDGKKVKNYDSIEAKILSLIKQKMNYIDVSDFDTKLHSMIVHRNAYMHSKKSYSPTDSDKVKE